MAPKSFYFCRFEFKGVNSVLQLNARDLLTFYINESFVPFLEGSRGAGCPVVKRHRIFRVLRNRDAVTLPAKYKCPKPSG